MTVEVAPRMSKEMKVAMQRIRLYSNSSPLIKLLALVLLGPPLLVFGSSTIAQTTQVSFAGASGTDAVIGQINSHIEQAWRDFELTPSPEAADGQWCRRVFLDVIGRIPTVTEVEKFIKDKAPDKKKRLVESLLYDDEYTEEFARNWTCLLYTSPSPRDRTRSRMPSSA